MRAAETETDREDVKVIHRATVGLFTVPLSLLTHWDEPATFSYKKRRGYKLHLKLLCEIINYG